LLNLVILLLWWFFNFAAPTFSVVVVVLHESVGDADCGRSVEKQKTRWLMMYLVEVPMAVLMSNFSWWYTARIIPGVGCVLELVS
jgi:hypothetical protein